MSDQTANPSPARRLLTLSSGYTVTVRPVSPYARQAIGQSIPAPVVPLRTVAGTTGASHEEPHPDDPTYKAALKAWQDAIALKTIDVLLSLGVEVEVDQPALTALREAMEPHGVQLPASDKMAFLKYIAIGSEADLTLLGDAIAGGTSDAPSPAEAPAATPPPSVTMPL